MLHSTALETAALLLQILASITPLQAVPRFSPPPKRVVQQQVPVICRDGWTPAVAENLDGGPSAYICIQTNRKSLPWKQSRDICRSNEAFLLKLDKRVRIGSQTLEEFITDQNLNTFWTGLHEEETKFVWDELNPSLVHSYAGPHAGYGKIKRGWRWNTDSFDDVTGKCGVISLNHTLSRRKRASNSDYDDYMLAHHNVDLDLPDSAPSGFRYPGLHRPPATDPSSKELLPFFLDGLNNGDIDQFLVTDAPNLTTVTDSSSEEDSNDSEDAQRVKRSTMTKIDVTEFPRSSDDDQADTTTSTTVKPSTDTSSTKTTDVTTTTPSTTSTSSVPTTEHTASGQFTSTEVTAGSTSLPNHINTTSTVTASKAFPTSTTTTTELPLLPTSSSSQTTSSSTETPSVQTTTTTSTTTTSGTSSAFSSSSSVKPSTHLPSTTSQPSIPRSTFQTPPTAVTPSTQPSTVKTTASSKMPTTSTTQTPSTTTLETMQNIEITRDAVHSATPFPLGTSDVTLPSSPAAASITSTIAATSTSTTAATTTTAATSTTSTTAATTTSTTAATSTTSTTAATTSTATAATLTTAAATSTSTTVKSSGTITTETEKVTPPTTNGFSKTETTTTLPPSPSPPPTTTTTSTTTSAPVTPETLMGHTERLTSSVGRPPAGQAVQYMSMDVCDSPHSSVCYSEPINALQQVSFCGFGWVGHPFVDKCYKVLTFPLNHFRAKASCIDEGGTMAAIDSDFYGNLTGLAYIQLRNKNTAVPPRVWVDVNGRDKITLTGGCPALHHLDVVQLACEKLMFSVCEKPASVRSFDNPISSSLMNQKKLLRMLSTQQQSIICPVQTSTPEEHVLWFKDGVRVQTSSDVHLQQTFNNVPIQQRARTLHLGLPLLRRLSESGGVMHPSRLQGNYWCEVWKLNPLRKVKSAKFLVVFTDVITLHGTLQTRGVPTNTSVVFNYMDRAVDVPLNVANYLAIINDNITRSMRMVEPGLRDIASYVHHIDSDTGVIDFFIQLSLVRNMPENYKDRVVSHYLTTLHSVLVPLSRDISQHWNLSLPVTDAINLTRTDFCPPAYLEDSRTGFGAQFPKTAIGNNVDSIELCDGVAVGYANCQGDYETGAHWENWQIDTDCHSSSASTLPVTDSDDLLRNRKPNNTEPAAFRIPGAHLPHFQLMPSKDLAHLDEIEIEDGNVRDVTDKMAEILDKTSGLTDADIDTCAEVIGRIVKVTSPSASQMGLQLLHTVNRILDADTAAIRNAQLKSRAATRIVENLEKFSMKTDIGAAKHMRLVTPNVAMEVWNLDAGMDPVIGLGASMGGSWSSPLTNPRILTIRDRLDSSLAEFDVAIELPQELVVKSMHGESNTTRLSMLIYRKTGLFTPGVNSTLGLVNSAIISATLGGKKIVGLHNMIRMAFRPFVDTSNHLKTTKCAFWDFLENQGMGGWSTDGCYYNGTMFGLDICMCNHLTNFAVLLDFYGHSKPVEPEHELTLSIISLVGLSLSIFGLALTIITFVFFKKLRQGRAQLTLFHMAVALLCSKVVFLVGIKQTNNEYFCLSVAVLLHYFILVSFLWMLIEAILQYMTFVKILGTYVSRYALKTAIPAWGLPLIPVVSVLSIDYNMYRGRKSYCWMGMEAFYYAFAVPVGVIVVINIIMFIIILASLVRRPDGLRSTQSKQRRARMHLKAAVTIFMLLGLTWIFGFLQIEDARIVFQYVFTLLSSLQGFFIFVMLVARRKQVRDQWYLLCCNKQDNRRAPKQVSPTNSNSTSSNGSGGSLSLHNSSTRTLRTNIDRESFDSVYYIPTRRMPTAYKAL
ncbi:uncharacterized protein LOC124144255 [Haliotis rufescens]|uniref:uncharacterized protein LOC124144255 n=1 Tax=Haliotis rufescens TaxID=6454 RepID=UPI00201F0254|nr:uncharacterized protein LOC124144255 [Haliotis rufescens]